MAKRETSATRKGRAGRQQTAAEKAAGAANLAKGRAAKQKAREEAARAEAEGQELMTTKERWSRLLDGTLTVKDLDDDEITKMRVKSKDGTFNGAARRLPSHLAQQFHQEAIRRANDKIRTAAPEAVQALLDIGRDPEVKESDRLKALMYVIDRGLGKTPDVVRVEGQGKFDALLDAAIDLDRDMADESTPGE